MDKLRQINISNLLVFDALIKYQSQTKAMDRLGRAQSSISSSLQKLREVVGDELFVAEGRKLIPTKRALEIYPAIEKALGLLENSLSEEITFDFANEEKQFKISASGYCASTILPPALEIITNSSRKIALTIDTLSHLNFSKNINELVHQYDLVIGEYLDSSDLPLIQSKSILVDDLVLCCNRDLFKNAKDNIQEIPHANQNNKTINGALDVLYPNRRRTVECSELSTLVEIIRSSDTIGVLPKRLIERFSDLKIVNSTLILPPQILNMYWHQDKSYDASNMWLRQLMSNVSSRL